MPAGFWLSAKFVYCSRLFLSSSHTVVPLGKVFFLHPQSSVCVQSFPRFWRLNHSLDNVLLLLWFDYQQGRGNSMAICEKAVGPRCIVSESKPMLVIICDVTLVGRQGKCWIWTHSCKGRKPAHIRDTKYSNSCVLLGPYSEMKCLNILSFCNKLSAHAGMTASES